MIGELLDRRRRNNRVIARRQHQDRLANPRRVMHRAEGVHGAEGGVRPGHRWSGDAERRIFIEDRRVTRITDGIADGGVVQMPISFANIRNRGWNYRSYAVFPPR
jgi:hypothetical protein